VTLRGALSTSEGPLILTADGRSIDDLDDLDRLVGCLADLLAVSQSE
jgi:hypothetical protein